MKKFLSLSDRKSTAFFLILFLLAGSFWMATTPLARGRQMSGREMIESSLPNGKNLLSANKPQVLDAVCDSVKKYRADVSMIIRAAVEAHRTYQKDVQTTAFHCIGTKDCGGLHTVVAELEAFSPDDAASVNELSIQLAPDCFAGGVSGRGEGYSDGGGPANQNPGAGLMGGGSGNQVSKCVVCHNGHTIEIPCSQVPKFLKNHPGDRAGPCQVTPSQNR